MIYPRRARIAFKMAITDTTYIGEDGSPHGGMAGRAKQHDDGFDAQRKDDILENNVPRPAGDGDGFSHLGRIVIHQHNIGCFNSRIGAIAPMAMPDVGAGQNRCIVDPISHKGQFPPLWPLGRGQQCLDTSHLVCREQPGVDFIQTELIRYRFGDCRRIAGQPSRFCARPVNAAR